MVQYTAGTLVQKSWSPQKLYYYNYIRPHLKDSTKFTSLRIKVPKCDEETLAYIAYALQANYPTLRYSVVYTKKRSTWCWNWNYWLYIDKTWAL